MTAPPEIPLELRKEWTRLRALLYETHDLALCTDERDGHRWLTDRYVLLDVTASIAIQDVEDGPYKLVQSKGFQYAKGSVNYLGAGIVDYLENVEKPGSRWEPVEPSEWSVAEHPGKAMLLTYLDVNGEPQPVLIGEPTWTALHRHFEEAYVDHHERLNLFRVWQMGPKVVAYIAGIRIPDGQEAVAHAIARAALDSKFN
jgi:hypothetical protein